MRRTRLSMVPSLVCLLTLATAEAAESIDPSTEPVKELTVDPRAVETPLLKYRLFPAEYELQDGNAAPILLRMPWEQLVYFREIVPKFKDLLDVPLNELLDVQSQYPQWGQKDILGFSGFYRQLKRAAHVRSANWEYPIGELPLAKILLPDVQGLRDLAGRGLTVWIRSHLANGRLEEAREGILVGFSVARHMGRSPFLIIQLVTAANDSMMLGCVEELISQPDSPNLYWALTALPNPLIDIRPSLELEQRMLEDTVPGLNNLDAVRSEEEWTALFLGIYNEFFDGRPDTKPSEAEMQELIEHLASRAHAERNEWRKDDPDAVARMSSPEAAVRWLLHLRQEQLQRAAAAMALDPPTAIRLLSELEAELSAFDTQFLLPKQFALQNPLRTYLSIAKIPRTITALRVVEAIRHYAATHNSQLPESLDQIVDTPVPDDPLTGKPFLYEVDNGTAVLRGPGFDIGTPENKHWAVIHYRIQLRKSAE